jgi:hypothetical protein
VTRAAARPLFFLLFLSFSKVSKTSSSASPTPFDRGAPSRRFIAPFLRSSALSASWGRASPAAAKHPLEAPKQSPASARGLQTGRPAPTAAYFSHLIATCRDARQKTALGSRAPLTSDPFGPVLAPSHKGIGTLNELSTFSQRFSSVSLTRSSVATPSPTLPTVVPLFLTLHRLCILGPVLSRERKTASRGSKTASREHLEHENRSAESPWRVLFRPPQGPLFSTFSHSLKKVTKRGGKWPPRAAAPSEKVELEQHVPLFAFGTFSKVSKTPCSTPFDRGAPSHRSHVLSASWGRSSPATAKHPLEAPKQPPASAQSMKTGRPRAPGGRFSAPHSGHFSRLSLTLSKKC